MMKPILFNTEMVRAILDGRKTVTRRVVKCSHRDAAGFNIVKNGNGEIVGVMDYDDNERSYEDYTIPPYRPDDILYVRETWAQLFGRIVYRADYDRVTIGYWRPSIHMPREAARIWLRVTDVRVERLQEIKEDGSQAEGLRVGWSSTPKSSKSCSARQAFMWIWDSTIKPADRERYGWAANPWVWVIEFERCERPEEV